MLLARRRFISGTPAAEPGPKARTCACFRGQISDVTQAAGKTPVRSEARSSWERIKQVGGGGKDRMEGRGSEARQPSMDAEFVPYTLLHIHPVLPRPFRKQRVHATITRERATALAPAQPVVRYPTLVLRSSLRTPLPSSIPCVDCFNSRHDLQLCGCATNPRLTFSSSVASNAASLVHCGWFQSSIASGRATCWPTSETPFPY
ncbi:hypothetical protein BCR34DRAFT_586788 [Clohesyomyces aquaticus]|uniref:Uncharacterized protein n=1 Tax=Clohesyomyces aquaticus TaxID=1231657 RepID=A0A1Y1ZS87_9PLEO|nr:hypothetical protein BCR34DRAFT_586788 [Clohesyomyces aquaticus]